MIRELSVIFRLSQAYSANTLIYRLRCLPVLKKLIPQSIYGSRGIKRLACVVSAIGKILMAFLGKFLYLFVFVLLPLQYLELGGGREAFYILVILSLSGGFLNGELFNPTKEKYYAIVLMHMNAKSYALACYFWFLIKVGTTFLAAMLVMGRSAGMSWWMCLAVPVFVLACKAVTSALVLRYYEKTGKLGLETNLKLVFTVSLAALALAYLPPLAGITFSVWFGYAMGAAMTAAAVFCIRYIRNYDDYGHLYKKMLTQNAVIFKTSETAIQTAQKSSLAKISHEQVQTGKKGFAYFHEIFVVRHRKILTYSARRTAMIAGAVLGAVLAAVLVSSEFSERVNRFIMTFLPYFIFIMYCINRGPAVTQAMFMNCDHSMLAYRFYRQPGTVRKLFWLRLKTIAAINLIPASVIALGLPILLFLTGGTDHWANYVVLFVSILAMSVFFSVHHLTLYYLLQPYNVNMESKSSSYAIANTITYAACYVCIRFQAPTLVFATLTILFTAAYMGLALFLAHRFAPGRFRLK